MNARERGWMIQTLKPGSIHVPEGMRLLENSSVT